MNIIDTSAATGVKGLPLRSTTLNFMQESMRGAIGMAFNVMFDNAYLGVANFKPRVLQGLTQAGNIIASGTIAYVRGGAWEACVVTGADITGYVGVPTMVADDTFDGTLDPTTMSDATTANVHSIRRYKIQDSNVGAGLVDYSDFVFPSDYRIFTKVLQIGDWDMDTTASVSVTHGLTLSKIRSIDVHIIEDGSINLIPLNSAGSFSADGTNVNLTRTGAGAFDSTQFNATSFNRGWITIHHIGA